MRNILALFSSNYISLTLALIASIYTKKMVGPEFAGTLTLVMVFTVYCGAFYDVLFTAIDREVPFARGKNDEIGAQNVHAQAFLLLVGSVLVTSIAFTVGLLKYWKVENFRWAIIIVQTVNIALALTGYIKVFSRVQGEFIRGSIYLTFAGVLLPSFRMVGAGLNNAEGYAIASFTGIIIVLLVSGTMFFKMPLVAPKKEFILRIFRSGIPVNLFFMILINFETIDRYFIVKQLSLFDLGLYSLATISMSTLVMMAMSVSVNLFLPTWYRESSSGQNLKVYESVFKSLLVTLVIISVGGVFIRIVVPYLIHSYLPTFSGSVEPLLILSLAAYWSFMTRPFVYFLSALGKFKSLLILAVVAVLLYAISIRFGVQYGLKGMSISVLGVYFIFSNIISIYAMNLNNFTLNKIIKDSVLLNTVGFIALTVHFIVVIRVPILIVSVILMISFWNSIKSYLKSYLTNIRSVRSVRSVV